jgi:hypothetical protein
MRAVSLMRRGRAVVFGTLGWAHRACVTLAHGGGAY